MSESGYSGWANYPTWAVHLWLTNEQALYEEASERTRYARTYADDHPNVGADIWTQAEAEGYVLAEALKSWVADDLAPDLGASFAADLLGFALDSVDWNEIAEALLTDADPEETCSR